MDGSLSPKPGSTDRYLPLLALLFLLVGGLGSVLLAIPAQEIPGQYFAVLALAIVLWLVYSLFKGFGIYAAALWMLIFLIKPLPLTYYGLVLSLPLYILARYYSGDQKRLVLPYPFAMVLLLVAGIVGLIRSHNPAHGAIYFVSTIVVPIFVMMLFANSRPREKDFGNWLKVAVLISALLGLIGLVMGIMNPDKRLGSLWITAMTINGFYTITFFFAVGLAFEARQKLSKAGWALAALLIFLGMMYTYTRVALISVVLGLGLIMWRIKRFRSLGIVALGLVPLAIPASMLVRFEAGFALDESLFIRFLAWYYAVGQIIRNPLLGMGISSWQSWYQDVVPIKLLYAEHPHNLFLKVWTDLGLLGFLPYFYVIGSVVKHFWKRRVKGKRADMDYFVLLGVLALLFSCLTDVFIQQYSVSIIFWCTMGFMLVRFREPKTDESPKEEDEGI